MHLYKEKKKEESHALFLSLYSTWTWIHIQKDGVKHIVGPITDFMRQQNIRYVKAFYSRIVAK